MTESEQDMLKRFKAKGRRKPGGGDAAKPATKPTATPKPPKPAE